jgi:hypothetical protein
VTPAEIILLVGILVVLGGFFLVLTGLCFVGYGLKKLRPEEENLNRLMLVDTKVANLESQVVQLRTKKAGRQSAENRGKSTPQPFNDPELEGLSPEEAALFM